MRLHVLDKRVTTFIWEKTFEGKEIIKIKSTGEKINLGRKEDLSLKTNNKPHPAHLFNSLKNFIVRILVLGLKVGS